MALSYRAMTMTMPSMMNVYAINEWVSEYWALAKEISSNFVGDERSFIERCSEEARVALDKHGGRTTDMRMTALPLENGEIAIAFSARRDPNKADVPSEAERRLSSAAGVEVVAQRTLIACAKALPWLEGRRVE